MESKSYREIIVKTDCGRGSKLSEYVQYLELPKDIVPKHIIGSTVTNVEKPKALKWKVPEKSSYYVPVKGTFSIDVWYAYNDGHDTDVATTSVLYHENIPILERSGSPIGPVSASAEIEDQPKISDVKIEDNKIRIEASIKISATVTGETRLAVEVV